MIVSPITRKTGVKEAQQKMWLPEGDWYNSHSNQMIVGNQIINEFFEFDQIPIYIKAGSIIPSQKDKLHISQSVLDTLILTIYPNAQERAEFELYEDEGISEGYQSGIFLKTALVFAKDNSLAQLEIHPKGIAFEGLPEHRTYVFQLVNSDSPKEIFISETAEKVNWNFNPNTLVLSFEVNWETLKELKLDIQY